MTKKNKNQQKKSPKTESRTPPLMTEETKGFLIFSLALILFLSLISFGFHSESKNLLGFLGYTIGWALHALFGMSSYLIVLFLGWIGISTILKYSLATIKTKVFYIFIAVISLSILLSLIEYEFPYLADQIGTVFYPNLWFKKQRYHLGGALFYYLYKDLPQLNLRFILNSIGVGLIFSTLFLTSLLCIFEVSLYPLFQKLASLFKFKGILAAEAASLDQNLVVREKSTVKIAEESKDSDFLRFVKLRIPNSSNHETTNKENNTQNSHNSELLAIQPDMSLKERPSLSRKEQSQPIEAIKQFDAPVENNEKEAFKRSASETKSESKPKRQESKLSIPNGDFLSYTLPPLSMITNAKKVDQSSLKKDLKKQAEVLEETLASFGIEAKVGQINCGPTITSFEVHPAIGVKVQKIKTLDNDIALNMEATSIRIIAPIPGKAAVGIEVPNAHPQEVGFKDMLLHYQQGSQKFHIPILLGKAVNGDYVMSDLAKMPHCIIAGATGSGKSVCINTIIMSIILNAKPDEIKLLMVDPKKVELTPYSKLPHMLAPVITEPQGAAAALQWLVKEMEGRYEILKIVGVRNIESFNQRTIKPEIEDNPEREIPEKLPYIVAIIDELADLMMVASQDIETPIARIAQMARAVGIHLILATQRPSREVITGLIKANFPTRISFKVASRVNSQIVLDEIGAESLLGNGDMLFLPPGTSHLIRAQGAFIRDNDILAIIKYICDQATPHYVIQSFDQMMGVTNINDFREDVRSRDTLFDQARDVILSTGNASTTFLQRKLKVGYARAASLMDQLEHEGIVGPAEGAKPRKIFRKKDSDSAETELESL